MKKVAHAHRRAKWQRDISDKADSPVKVALLNQGSVKELGRDHSFIIDIDSAPIYEHHFPQIDAFWENTRTLERDGLNAKISKLEERIATEVGSLRAELQQVTSALKELAFSAMNSIGAHQPLSSLPSTHGSNLSHDEILHSLNAIAETDRCDDDGWAAVALEALASESPQLRSAAALALPALVERSEAARMLGDRIAVETNKYVRSALDGALYEVTQ